MQEKHITCCRWSPTLGELEDTHENVWGTKSYDPLTDIDKPCVFFGLYGLPDFYALWRHKGPKYILWAGSDITHFVNGYWLDETGHIRIDPRSLAKWIDTNCKSYVENEVEKNRLAGYEIRSTVGRSFLGDISTYPQSYQHSSRPKLYTSVSGDNFELYDWYAIPNLARAHPDIEFHLYGNTKDPYPASRGIGIVPKNIVLHGRVPKEQMNEEIKHMQGALRLTEFDGFSEILAKSVLMGQWPVSLIPYPYMLTLDDLDDFPTKPNIAGREYYQKTLNQFPWNLKS